VRVLAYRDVNMCALCQCDPRLHPGMPLDADGTVHKHYRWGQLTPVQSPDWGEVEKRYPPGEFEKLRKKREDDLWQAKGGRPEGGSGEEPPPRPAAKKHKKRKRKKGDAEAAAKAEEQKARRPTRW